MKMKDLFKKAGKRILAGFMTAVMAVTSLNIVSFAADVTAGGSYDVSVDWYSYSYNFAGRLGHSFYGQIVKLTVNSQPAYCIRCDEDAYTGNYTAKDDYDSLTSAQQKNIGYALTYGYQGSTRYGYAADEERIATQIMVWNIVDGYYNNSDESTALTVFTEGMSSSMATNVKTVYNRIKSQMLKHDTKPSYSGSKYKMTANSDGTYSITISDSNGVSSYFDWTTAIKNVGASSYLSVTSVSTNSITFKSTKAIPNGIRIENAEKNKSQYLSSLETMEEMFLGSTISQDCATYVKTDPPDALIILYTDEDTGTVNLQKSFSGTTATAAMYMQCQFAIKNSSGAYLVLTSTSSAGVYTYSGTTSTSEKSYGISSAGVFKVSGLPAGTYTVIETASPSGWSGANKTVTITAGNTANVTFTNTSTGGTAKIQKSFSGTTANMAMYMQVKFALRNSSGKYLVLSSTSTTGVYNYSGSTSSTAQSYGISSTGAFQVNKLPAGTYTIIETASPSGWSGANKTFTLAEGETKEIPFENTQDGGEAKIKKSFVSGSNLSSAELAALYGDIYFTITSSDGKYVYPTGASTTGSYTYSGTRTAEYRFMVNTTTGEFLVSGLPAGKYTVTEVNKAEGYRPATQAKTLTVSAGQTASATFINTSVPTITIKKKFSDESNMTADELKEQYKKVKIKITNSYVPDTHTLNVTGSNGDYTAVNFTQGENWLTLSDEGEMTIVFENAVPGTYTVYESYDGDEYELADTQTFTLSSNPNAANVLADIEIENIRKAGNVKVIKTFTDTDGGNVLVSDEQISSVSFVITNATGRELTFTGSNGSYQYSGAATRGTELKLSVADKTLVAKNIPVGNYTISEISGAEGFNFEVEEEHFTVLAADDTEITFVNEAMKGNLHIQKKSSDNELSGWRFRVELVESPFEGYTYDKTFTTDSKGEITIENLRIGTYKVTEVTTGVVGYITPEAQTAVIEDSKTTNLTFTNVPIGNVHVTKVDRDYTGVKLTGAEFTVTAAADIVTASGERLYSEGDIIGTLTESEKGEYQLNDLPYGDYYLQETKAPANYVEDENIYSFSIREANKTVQVGTYGDSVFLNEPMSGQLHIQKHSADGVLENWKFRVELVSSPFEGYTYDHIFVTSKDGGITLENLRIGTYRVTEVVTGDEAYITPPPKDVTIVFGGDHTVDMDNIPLGSVHVTKVDVDYPDNKLTGAEFTVYMADKQTEVGKLTEISTGEYQLDDIPYGDYYIQETKAPANYVKDDNYYPFSIRIAGATVDVETKEQVDFENVPMKGHISIKKSSDDGVIAGWQFSVQLVDSPFTTDYTYDQTFTTDANGEISINNLRIGTYKITEVVTGDEYYITPDAKNVTVGHNKITNVEFTNIPLGNVRAYKVDKDYPDIKLSGAEFTVYGEDKVTLIGTLEEIEKGTYELQRIPYGNYYLKETKAPDNFVIDNNYYPFVIREAGETVVVGNVTAAVSLPVSKSYGNMAWAEQEYAFPQTGLIISENAETRKYPAINSAVMNEYVSGDDVTVTALLDNYYKLSDGAYIKSEKVQLNAAATDFMNDRYPEIGTTATVNGGKETIATGTVTIKDVISYKHLIPGNEYLTKGVLMDKSTGKALLINGKTVTAETTFTAETESGEVLVEFTFNADGLTTDTEIVVYETLYLDGIEIAAHADIDDKGQTVTLRVPEIPDNPPTGVKADLGLKIGLCGVGIGGIIAAVIIFIKKKKEDESDDE